MHNEIKLSFSDYQYYINYAKKTVTCKVSCRLHMPNNVTDIYNIMRYALDLPYINTFTQRATAHLNPTDKFDDEVGVKIARAKAESAAYKKVEKALNMLLRTMSEVNIQTLSFTHKANNVITHNDEYIASF